MTSRGAPAQHLRDLARLRRGDQGVTEVCSAVGCSSPGASGTSAEPVRASRDPAGGLVRIPGAR